jgi:hypothetical protein
MRTVLCLRRSLVDKLERRLLLRNPTQHPYCRRVKRGLLFYQKETDCDIIRPDDLLGLRFNLHKGKFEGTTGVISNVLPGHNDEIVGARFIIERLKAKKFKRRLMQNTRSVSDGQSVAFLTTKDPLRRETITTVGTQ